MIEGHNSTRCGSTDVDTIEYAKQKGLEIVTFDPVKLSREHISGEQALCLLK